MKNRFKEIRETTNYRVQKLLERSIVLGCPICGPHSGCNTNYDLQYNWKKFRKTRWK